MTGGTQRLQRRARENGGRRPGSSGWQVDDPRTNHGCLPRRGDRGGGSRPAHDPTGRLVHERGVGTSELLGQKLLGLPFTPGEGGREPRHARRAERLDRRAKALPVLFGRAEEGDHRCAVGSAPKEAIVLREAKREAPAGRPLVSWTVPPRDAAADARGHLPISNTHYIVIRGPGGWAMRRFHSEISAPTLLS